MKKNSDKKEDKPKNSELIIFLKKRAPIYLAIIAICVIFVIPEFTKNNLQSSLPDNLSNKEKQIVEILMSNNGPNNKGLTVIDAISNKIANEYPDEKIYDNKKTKINLLVSSLNESIDNNYKIILLFESYKGKINYEWDINSITKKIEPRNSNAKNIIDLVNYYD